jgi:hypothetical protein
VNNLPIDMLSPDYTGRQSFEDLVPYTPSGVGREVVAAATASGGGRVSE